MSGGRIRLDGADGEYWYFSSRSWSGSDTEYTVAVCRRTGWVECTCPDSVCRRKGSYWWKPNNLCKHAREVVRLIMDKLPMDLDLIETSETAYHKMTAGALISELRAAGGKATVKGIEIPEDADEGLRREVERRRSEIDGLLKDKHEARQSARRFAPIGGKAVSQDGEVIGKVWGVTADSILIVKGGSIRRYDPRDIKGIE